MINFWESNIEAILPGYLSETPEVQAISYAIAKQIQNICRRMEKEKVYVAVDNLSEDVLDLLALEMRSQYYSDTMEIQEKREIIKNTMKWYMKAGTASAVREMVNIVLGEGRVVEWFDFTEGEKIPGTFEIETEAGLTTDILSEVSKKIKNVKNARSHIRRVKILRGDKGTVRAGSGVFIYSRIHITGRDTDAGIISGGYNGKRAESESKGRSRKVWH